LGRNRHHTPGAAGDGADEMQRHEFVELLCSFYGPDADTYCGLFRDGIQVAQNREVLQLAAMGVVGTGDPLPVPSLVKDQWLYRVDLPLTIKRQIRRNYPILNLLSAEGTIEAQRGEQLVVNETFQVSE
jgi:hypothetical protein